ncbi:MAG: methyltransferase domain-containing protein, partial [Bacteroidia bacterium]|nr:methyltransferase domain-containing protein [Bacteroidia bacterium]
AQIKLISALRRIIEKSGQLWIATHSVHILSHLNYDEIFMVKDSEIITPSRTTPGKSFNDLMGIDEHIHELTTFMTSMSEWAYGNFMTQCFKEPDVIFGNNTKDPQFKLFKQFLSSKGKINLLDFGAGKGRIGYTIHEDEIVSKKIVYNAYDPNEDNIQFLKDVPEVEKIFTNDLDIPKNIYDCIIVCNVLHEIHPKQWVKTLLLIKSLLKSNGYLLIIEDRYLPKGETAHEYGYLVFSGEETNILLGSTSPLELRLEEPEYKDRIIFNAYTKQDINPGDWTVIDALKKLNQNCYTNIKKLKGIPSDVNIGRRYANETQLYINSLIALEDIEIN